MKYFCVKLPFKKGNGSTLCCCKLTESPLGFAGYHTDVPKMWPVVLRAMSETGWWKQSQLWRWSWWSNLIVIIWWMWSYPGRRAPDAEEPRVRRWTRKLHSVTFLHLHFDCFQLIMVVTIVIILSTCYHRWRLCGIRIWLCIPVAHAKHWTCACGCTCVCTCMWV